MHTSLIAVLLLAAPALSTAQPAGAGVSLDVPYVPQSEALCGGAAVAMVYRYWGDAHADARQFAPLVDARAGGIAEDVLIDAVRQRGWRTARVTGSLEFLREHIGGGRPVIILLEDRPTRYHYVVVTGAEPDAIVIHDPSWGPSRRIPETELLRAWKRAQFWALLVLPSGVEQAPPLPRVVEHPGTKHPGTKHPGTKHPGTEHPGTKHPGTVAPWHPGTLTECTALTNEAVERVRARGLDTADTAFADVRARCPESAAPLRELAGVRFAQKRWQDAEDLAAQAVARDSSDHYAWEVLASSRFVQNEFDGALRAWNQIGKPLVDSVDITGLTHARYELIARTIGLTPSSLLTADAFARAERRVSELPDRSSARIAFRPADDSFASVNVALVERSTRPRGAAQWGAATAKSLLNREINVDMPGFTGQGELWSAHWRWWSARPRVAIAFAAPRAGAMPGVWRVDGSWESQRYIASAGAEPFVEKRAHVGLAISDWASGRLRYGIGAGFDEWNGDWRTASAMASLERRFAGDRLTVVTDAALFLPVSSGGAFRSASVRASARTSISRSRWVLIGTSGATAVSSQAPLALWPEAGDGHARTALLRAHPLLEDGTIGGAAFGRTLIHAGGELQRGITRSLPVRVGVAGFLDAARAARTMAGAGGTLQVDAGVGLRVKVPGADGTLRLDVARGMRDGATALTVGWVSRQ